MSSILIDSSVWIEYFRGSNSIDRNRLEELIDNNQICTNNIILAELIPSLLFKKQHEVVDILKIIKNIPIIINWDEIFNFQFHNLKHGINGVGIPDLIILQNITHNDLVLFSLDKHFMKMQTYNRFKIIS